jgi:hypothetical protein
MKPRRWMLVLPALVVAAASFPNDAAAQSAPSKAAPPSAVPTISLNNVARHGFFYAGGAYVGELGPNKESTMGGAMYYDPCIPKWLNQAGVKTDFLRLETVRISGNSHMMMLDIVGWIQKNVTSVS